MKKFKKTTSYFHGTKKFWDGSIFWLVPGTDNWFGLGVYFTPDPKYASSYGRDIIVIRNNKRIGLKQVYVGKIFISRHALKLRVRYVQKDKKHNRTFYHCTVVDIAPLEKGGSIIEKKISPSGKVLRQSSNQDKRQGSSRRFAPRRRTPDADESVTSKQVDKIKRLDWRRTLNWPDPKKPTIIDRLLGIGLGLVLGMVSRLKGQSARHLEWLSHYLLGIGGRRRLSPDEVKDLIKVSRSSEDEKRGRYLMRPDPNTSPVWFNTVGTYIAKRKGQVIHVYDVYRFGRQPGQAFSPDDIMKGGNKPMIWATSAFAACNIVIMVVKILRRVSRAARMHMSIHGNTVLISNGFWKALGGKPFVTEGYCIDIKL